MTSNLLSAECQAESRLMPERLMYCVDVRTSRSMSLTRDRAKGQKIFNLVVLRLIYLFTL